MSSYSDAYGTRNAVASLTTAARVISARADVAYAFASLVRTHAKGNLGEAYAQRYFIRNKLGEAVSGKWTSLTPRTGRQGFDHLFVRRRGNKFLWMVCESKYDKSTLGVLKDGTQQMSWKWIHDRAAKLGDQYLAISKCNVTPRKLPWLKNGIKTFDVPLEDGSKVTFWKGKDGKWRYDGPMDKLSKAQETAGRMGLDLKSDMCNIRGRKFHIMPSGNDVKITLYEVASEKGSTKIDAIKKVDGGELILKGILDKHLSDEELKKMIAEELHKKFPNLTSREIKELTEEIAERKTNGSLLKEAMATTGTIALQSLAAAGIASVFDSAIQFALTRKIDLRRVAITAAAAATGTVAGQVTSIILIKTKGGASMVRYVSRIARLRNASLMRNSIAGGAGAVLTSAVTAYGSAWLGQSTWKEANQEFIAGVGGTVGGGLTVTGATSLIVMFGHASTGTAISALSGAAQVNAILAWAGRLIGCGKAAGGILMGGVGIVATIVIGWGISYAFKKHGEAEARELVLLKGKLYDDQTWNVVASRMLREQTVA